MTWQEVVALAIMSLTICVMAYFAAKKVDW
jgi:hypothetical protein